MLVQSPRLKLPKIRLISGEKVQNPLAVKPRQGHTIKHGVELDAAGRQVAYWVTQEDGTSARIPARGERSGRRIAWLYYGTDKRLDDVRGQPLLALVLQSLKEIDRYRDSAQRKAVINSILAMFIKKTEDKPGTKPMTGRAVRRDEASVTDGDGTARTYNLSSQIPGVILDELQQGEEPVGFNSAGTDINFPAFEAAIVHTISWACEYPPEVVTLAFQNNYSASRGAVNELKLYLDKFHGEYSDAVLAPIYQEWLVSEVLLGKISAPGFLDAWRDISRYDIYGAWIASDWSGAIKPSVDLKKEVSAYRDMIKDGLITHDRAARELTNTKWSKNIRRMGKENELKAAALKPLLELQAEFGVEITANPVTAMTPDALIEAAAEKTLELMEVEE
jgi:capsid protein